MLHIVDDDVDLQNALVWMAKSRQLPCISYSSGEQFLTALEIIKLQANEDNGAPKWQYDTAGDCVLLDVRMSGMSGIATFDVLAAHQLTKRLPVIFITGHGDVPMAVDALKRGAFDFFEKPFNDNALFDRVEVALQESLQAGQTALIYERLTTLSTREREVLDLMLQGKMNKVIADELGISMRTVEVHRAHVFDKMEVKSAVELAGLLK